MAQDTPSTAETRKRTNGSGRPPGSDRARPDAEDRAGPPEPVSGSDEHRDSLYRQVKQELASESLHDEEIQYELARWLELLETSAADIRTPEGPADKETVVQRLRRKAGAAIPALISDKPELVFARTLRVRAEMDLLRHDGWATQRLVAVTDGSPVMIVGIGTFTAVLVGLAIHLAWPWLAPVEQVRNLVPLDFAATPAVIGAAYLGGLVSVLSRLESFSKLRDFDPMFLFLNALAKPFLGVVFGLFAYAALKSGFLPLKIDAPDPTTTYHLWAIGFLAGFSERFANDLGSRGAGLAAPKKS